MNGRCFPHFVRIEVEGIRQVDPVHQMSELRAEERRSSVGGIHMEPQSVLLAHGPQLIQAVEGTRGGGAQSR